MGRSKTANADRPAVATSQHLELGRRLARALGVGSPTAAAEVADVLASLTDAVLACASVRASADLRREARETIRGADGKRKSCGLCQRSFPVAAGSHLRCRCDGTFVIYEGAEAAGDAAEAAAAGAGE